ncbi:AI-2E family transporter [Parasphingorhabdus halotolerans]|uniref:AI-2E family transporter n=1 Tax=Parasphingorhabdus halotolerans TaxID=2725558 RepID=A0A6H2DM61_9SPHN|nr:AI-2E family transporter [Parasphingorhabdus halotolerans]QJB68841.1 AI-2E family transporter [Parasphingorhabdus halotolerans]
MVTTRVSTIFFSVGLTIMIGWLFYVGKDIILPIVTAVILLQILYAASAAVARLPGLGRTPIWLRATLALIGFLMVLFAMTRMLVASLQNLVPSLPLYQRNLENLFASWFPVSATATEPKIRAAELMASPSEIFDRGSEAVGKAVSEFANSFFTEIDIASIAQTALSSITSFGGFVFITILYASFMLSEITGFPEKVRRAFGNDMASTDTLNMFTRINHDIGSYLATKTLINIMLGVVCWIILVIMGVEYAVLWAIIIGLLNYIPYIGSIVGVAFPALFAVAQFGTLTTPLIATGLLTAAQMIIGNVVEPRMLSKSVNLSPMVVLISLAIWASLWGIPGAILAVPFTTILMIVLARRETTRPIAALLSADGNV